MLVRNYLTLGLNKFFSRCASICLMKICLDRWTRNVQNLAVIPQILISTILIYKQSQTEFLLTKISSGFDKGSAKRSSLSSSKSTTCSCLMPKKKKAFTLMVILSHSSLEPWAEYTETYLNMSIKSELSDINLYPISSKKESKFY